MKQLEYLLLLITFLLFSGVARSQKRDTFYLSDYNNLQEISDTLKLDSALPENIEIDENLNDIFESKMDSSTTVWDAETSLPIDTPEEQRVYIYPRNLPDSVYIKRLMDSEQVIDLSYNKVVRNFIELYTEKRRSQVEMILGLSEYYFPIFEEVLDKYSLPLELKYMPIIESALNPLAMSRAGANGLWQFMFRTAKELNLEITSFVDERRDPVKATEAAAIYLKQLFDIYGDWQLAIAAYNCGPGNVNKAIRRSGGKTDYWEIYYYLPRETRGYVPAFIAASYVMNYYREHLLLPKVYEIYDHVDTLHINNYLHFNQIAEALQMDKNEIYTLNPMYRTGVVPAMPKKSYPLVLPEEKIMEFIDKDDIVFNIDRDKYFPENTLTKPVKSTSSYFTPGDMAGKAKIIYKVKSGDNVGYISSWFNVRSSDLRYWNNIRRNMIKVGQKLVIYVPEKDKAKYEQVARNHRAGKQKPKPEAFAPTTFAFNDMLPDNTKFEYYTVKNGDNIWDIAKKFPGISSDDILHLNNISNVRNLKIGQKLKIRKKG